MPISPELIDKGLDFAKNNAEGLGNIASGIIGSGARKREEQRARAEQREALANYKNFDFNQDVGFIADPYAQLAGETAKYEAQQNQQALANALSAQQQSGQFTNVTGLVGQNIEANQQATQRLEKLRSAGIEYTDKIRQDRISTRYSQAQTLLGRADKRLAAARKARQQATQSIIKGVGQVVGGPGGSGTSGQSTLQGNVGTLNDPTYSAGGYNASQSFLSNTQQYVPQVPNLLG